MHAEPSLAIQDAVYFALAGVNAANSRIYLDVPQNTPLPYVEFGQDHVIGAHQEGGDMFDADVDVTAYAADPDQLKTVVDAIYRGLFAPIAVTGFKVFEWHYEGVRYSKDHDDTLTPSTVYQATCSFRYMLERQPQ